MAAHAVQSILLPVRGSSKPVLRRSGKAIRRARTLAVLFVLLVAAVVLLFPRVVHTQGLRETSMGAEYTVVAGDTLWEIAARNAGNRDVREVIYQIEKVNGLKSVEIQPGQVLVIPTVPRTTVVGR